MIRKVKRFGANFLNIIKSYVVFTIYILLWFVILILITPFFAELLNHAFNTSFAISDFILYITAAFIVATTYETKKTREQTRETELRPIILRQGFIANWDSVKYVFENNKLIDGKPIEFKVVKKIATGISGYIILNGKKYDLLFGSRISQVSDNLVALSRSWGWLEEGATLFAVYHSENFNKAFGKNRIYIKYKNIENKEYYTVEYDDFSQESFAV